jgi:hypothetical protein
MGRAWLEHATDARNDEPHTLPTQCWRCDTVYVGTWGVVPR